MRMLLVLSLVLIPILAHGEDGPIESPEQQDNRFWLLINELNSDDFQVRLDTTEKLSKFPEEFVKKLLQVSSNDPRPEVKSRAYLAAFKCFCLTVLPKSSRWRFAFGTLGIETKFIWIESPSPQQNTVDGLEVELISESGPCNGKLMEMDLIRSINGKPPFPLSGAILAGDEYELAGVRRIKQPPISNCGTIESVLNQPYFKGPVPFGEIDFKFKIKAAWTDTARGYDVDGLMEIIWSEYHNGKPASKETTVMARQRAEVVAPAIDDDGQFIAPPRPVFPPLEPPLMGPILRFPPVR